MPADARSPTTQVARQQLRVQSELAAALCKKAGIPSCKKLREATTARWSNTELSIAELAMLGALGSVVPSLRSLYLFDNVAEPGGMQRLAAGLGAGSLPCVTRLVLGSMQMGDAGAVALAAALNRGALARLEALSLGDNGIGDAGLVALAPALRRLPALKQLWLVGTSRCREHGLSTAEQASASMAPRRVRQSQGVPRRRLGAVSLTHSCSGHYPLLGRTDAGRPHCAFFRPRQPARRPGARRTRGAAADRRADAARGAQRRPYPGTWP